MAKSTKMKHMERGVEIFIESLSTVPFHIRLSAFIMIVIRPKYYSKDWKRFCKNWKD